MTTQTHLMPCPFCGGRAEFNEHDDECYFTALAKAKAAPKADVSGILDLIPAWNRRTTPPTPAVQMPEAMTDERAIELAMRVTGNASASLISQQIVQFARLVESHVNAMWAVRLRAANAETTRIVALLDAANDELKRLRAVQGETVATDESGVPLAWRSNREGLIAYILQDDLHNCLTPRIVDIAYSAFMRRCSGKNAEDGGPCDWFNDTKPMVMEQIAKIAKDLSEAPVTHPAVVPEDVQRDAERYRWLRRCRGQEHDPLFTVQHELDGTLWCGDLDAAIDAAITAAQAQEGGK